MRSGCASGKVREKTTVPGALNRVLGRWDSAPLRLGPRPPRGGLFRWERRHVVDGPLDPFRERCVGPVAFRVDIYKTRQGPTGEFHWPNVRLSQCPLARSGPTRIIKPALVRPQHMLPFTMKVSPPTIFFATTSRRPGTMRRTRSAVFSS